MSRHRVPLALSDRLGGAAKDGLLELLDSAGTEWTERVPSVATDRFERRLAEEISGLRVAVTRELHEGLAAIRQEIATVRVELLKWSFLFWVGQVAAMAGLFALMFRMTHL